MAARSAYSRIAVNGASAQTTTTATIAASGAISVACASLTDWPTGAVMPVGLNIGEADEEHVWATRSTNTLIVDAADRGSDGTSAQSHASGITVDIIQFGEMSDESNETVAETLGQISAAGEMWIGDGANSVAALDVSGDAKIIVGNGTTAASVAVSGDATIDNTGAVSLAADSVDTAEIAAGAVDTAELAADAVDGTKLADDAVDSEHYTDGSIDTAHIANLQVTTGKLAADAVDGTKIADDAVDSEHVAADSLDAEHYAPGSVDATAIAAAVAGDGLTGAAGTAMAVGTDGSLGVTADAVATLRPTMDKNVVLTNQGGTTTPAAITGARVTVDAAAGDLVSVDVSGLWDENAAGIAGRLDAYSTAGVRYLSDNGPANEGWRSWSAGAATYQPLGSGIWYEVQADDISGGNLEIDIYIWSNTGTRFLLHPITVTLINWGPQRDPA